MYLADVLEGEVRAWVEQGWHGVTQTTLELFNYWSRGMRRLLRDFIHASKGLLKPSFTAMKSFRQRHFRKYLKE